jgi:hypothetical protein
MWEQVGWMAGAVVLVALFALLPRMWELPDLIGKWFNRPKRLAELASSDPDEAAAHVLGDALRRGQPTATVAAEITAAFWVADGKDRRALAYLVAGMCANGPVNGKDLLAVVRSRRPEHAPPAEEESPHADTARPKTDLPQDGIRPLRERV